MYAESHVPTHLHTHTHTDIHTEARLFVRRFQRLNVNATRTYSNTTRYTLPQVQERTLTKTLTHPHTQFQFPVPGFHWAVCSASLLGRGGQSVLGRDAAAVNTQEEEEACHKHSSLVLPL